MLHEEKEPLEELIEDFLTIIVSFAGKIYGKRNHKVKKLVEHNKRFLQGNATNRHREIAREETISLYTLIYRITLGASDEGGSTTHGVWVVPRGEKMLTLKAQGKLVDGSFNELREELYMSRRAVQYIIDCLWELDKLPSINQLHQMSYKMLREQGFRAHQAKQIYKYALGIVKSAKENNGSKPVLNQFLRSYQRG